MANVSRLNGFMPVRHFDGSPYNGQGNWYELPVGDATTCFVGDLVAMLSGTATDHYPTVTRLAASGEVTSGLVLGAIMGFAVDPTNLNSPQYRAASTKKLVFVADADDLIYEVQDGATTPVTAALVNSNCGVQCTAGSTTTGLSNMTTGATTPTTTNSLPLKIIGFVNKPNNAYVSQASQRLLVTINQHYYMGGQTAAS